MASSCEHGNEHSSAMKRNYYSIWGSISFSRNVLLCGASGSVSVTDNDGSVIKLCSVSKSAEQKFGKVSCSILVPSKGARHAGIGGRGEEVGETSE